MSETTDKLLETLSDLAQKIRELAIEAADIARQAAENLASPEPGAIESMSTMVDGGVSPFVFQLAIFVLAIFVGYYVVWQVTPALHTPLMAVTNAISSVIVVGAILAVGVASVSGAATAFGFIALVLAAVNIFGGFLVTQRMLAMYKKKER